MREANKVYLSLGSNLGDRAQNLAQALGRLELADIQLLKLSSVYESEPQDVATQPWFLNMVAEGETRLLPLQLLRRLLKIEEELGRVRGRSEVPRGPRTIDIDMLLFAEVQMQSPELTLPHPRMLLRRFVLEPLLEIAPELRHPETKAPLSGYLPFVSGQQIRRYDGWQIG